MSGSSSNEVQETADQVQQQKNNINLFNYQQEVYKPYIDKYIKQQTGYAASPLQSQKVAGQVNAEVMKGVSGRSPANAIGITKQLDNAASVGAQATTSADGKVKRLQDASLQNIVDIGRGQQTAVAQGQDQAASSSLRTAISNKESDLRLAGSMEDSVGSAAGAAAGAYYDYGLNKGGGNPQPDPVAANTRNIFIDPTQTSGTNNMFIGK